MEGLSAETSARAVAVESLKGISLVNNYLFKDITVSHIFQCI